MASDPESEEKPETRKRSLPKRKSQRISKKPKGSDDSDSDYEAKGKKSKAKKIPKKKTSKVVIENEPKKNSDVESSEDVKEKGSVNTSASTSSPSEASLKSITEDDSKYLKIVSWNVASFRTVLKKGIIQDYIKREHPDVLFLQETKLNNAKDCDNYEAEGYHAYWNYCTRKKGYSGTVCFTKIKPVSVSNEIGYKEHDQEGRSITVEFEDYYVIGTYIPNAGQKLDRLKYRTTEWDRDFLTYLQGLDSKKPVIWCGDLNVAHHPIDINKPNPKLAGYTPEERENFTKLLNAGFVDVFRKRYPDKVQYTYWNMRGSARQNNVGWRLDYFVVSDRFYPKVVDTFVRQDFLGSDHAPIGLLLPRP